MAYNLISPAVVTTLTDDSAFIPNTSQTIPLIFMATEAERFVTVGGAVQPAAGTFEANVLRTLTTFSEAFSLYGVPRFLQDATGQQLHGDCRNEYGLLAAYKFLQQIGTVYAIRADVDLNDDPSRVRVLWASKVQAAAQLASALVAKRINDFNTDNGYFVGHPMYKQTVNANELAIDLNTAIESILLNTFAFRNIQGSFEPVQSPDLPVYSNGYNQPPVAPNFNGVGGLINDFVVAGIGSIVPTEFTPTEAAQILLDAGGDYQFTMEFRTLTSLGATDAQRRIAIAQALQATITTNTDIRSESLDYNLIICPGFPEVADEIITLIGSVDLGDEVFAIIDTPFDLSPTEVVNWATSTTAGRRFSIQIAYYYPHGITSNVNGVDVFVPSSVGVLPVFGKNDNQAEVWRSPAGTERGRVDSFSRTGYVRGTLGTATQFIDASLSRGDRDNLYKIGTAINPIPSLPGRGIVALGAKTSFGGGGASVLDRIPSVRLVAYVRRTLRRNLFIYLFKPNDKITRDAIGTAVTNFLNGIMTRRGLFDFAVDTESGATPDNLNNHIIEVRVALQILQDVEFIVVPIRVVNASATL